MHQYIESTLQKTFKATHIEVINESSGHNVAPGAETHFKVVVVSDDFKGLSAVKRHQSIYQALAQALAQGVHALAIHAYTMDEWATKVAAPESPACLGGSRK